MAGSWIIVADSSRARIFWPVQQGRALDQVAEFLNPAARAHERDLTTDRPGRTFDSEGPGRHAMSENVSPKQHEAWKLCKELADFIETARAQGRFDRLILVAGPALLGELRKTLSDHTSRLIVDTQDKNLSDMTAEEILKHLPDQSYLA